MSKKIHFMHRIIKSIQEISVQTKRRNGVIGRAMQIAAWLTFLTAASLALAAAPNGSTEQAGGKDPAAGDPNAPYQRVLDDLRALKASPDALRSLAGSGWFRPYCCNPVLSSGHAAPSMGNNNSWDGFALGSMTVCKAGDVYHMYYEAWGKRDYHTLQIGHAVSLDGVHWAKDPGNPVLHKGDNGQWDADGAWDPFVLYEDGKFKMWYGGGMDVCNWGYAESTDGRHFVKKGKLGGGGGVEDCHVVHDRQAGKYYMYYYDRALMKAGNGLLRVESPNETDFDFKAAKKLVIEGEKYPGIYTYPHVFKAGGVWYMFYADYTEGSLATGPTRFATSTDGLNWKKVGGDLLAGFDAEVLPVGDVLLMFYGPHSYFDQDDCDIRLAIYKGTLSDLAAGKANQPAPGQDQTGR